MALWHESNHLEETAGIAKMTNEKSIVEGVHEKESGNIHKELQWKEVQRKNKKKSLLTKLSKAGKVNSRPNYFSVLKEKKCIEQKRPRRKRQKHANPIKANQTNILKTWAVRKYKTTLAEEKDKKVADRSTAKLDQSSMSDKLMELDEVRLDFHEDPHWKARDNDKKPKETQTEF